MVAGLILRMMGRPGSGVTEVTFPVGTALDD